MTNFNKNFEANFNRLLSTAKWLRTHRLFAEKHGQTFGPEKAAELEKAVSRYEKSFKDACEQIGHADLSLILAYAWLGTDDQDEPAFESLEDALHVVNAAQLDHAQLVEALLDFKRELDFRIKRGLARNGQDLNFGKVTD